MLKLKMNHHTRQLWQQLLVPNWAELKTKHACNLLPGGVTLYSSPYHETKQKICSREINFTNGEIKRRWDAARQPSVSFHQALFLTRRLVPELGPAERRDGSSVTFTYWIVFPPATMQNQHVKGVHEGCDQGGPGREPFPLNSQRTLRPPADIARPCITCVWAVNC